MSHDRMHVVPSRAASLHRHVPRRSSRAKPLRHVPAHSPSASATLHGWGARILQQESNPSLALSRSCFAFLSLLFARLDDKTRVEFLPRPINHVAPPEKNERGTDESVQADANRRSIEIRTRSAPAVAGVRGGRPSDVNACIEQMGTPTSCRSGWRNRNLAHGAALLRRPGALNSACAYYARRRMILAARMSVPVQQHGDLAFMSFYSYATPYLT